MLNASVNGSFTKKEKKMRKRNRLTMDAVKNNSVDSDNIDMDESVVDQPENMQNGNTTKLSPTKKLKKEKKTLDKSQVLNKSVEANQNGVKKEKKKLDKSLILNKSVEENGNGVKKEKKKIEKSLILDESVEESGNGVKKEKKKLDKSLILNKSVEENGNIVKKEKKKIEKSLILDESVEESGNGVKKEKKKLDKSLILNKSVQENELDVKNENKKLKESFIMNEAVEENVHVVKEPASEDFISLETKNENKGPDNNVGADGTNITRRKFELTEEEEARSIFVSNLPTVARYYHLTHLFNWAGKVTKINFKNQFGSRMAGPIVIKTTKAHIILGNEAEAKKALQLNGIFFYGLHLEITPFKKHVPLGDPHNIVFLANLPTGTSEEKIREIFNSCGEIKQVKIMDTQNKRPVYTAFVCFKSSEAASLALKLHQTRIDNILLFVERYSQEKKDNHFKEHAKHLENMRNKNKGFPRFEKTTKASNTKNNPKSQFKPKFESKPAKNSEFRGVKPTLKKVQKVKKPKKEQMQWVIEQVAATSDK